MIKKLLLFLFSLFIGIGLFIWIGKVVGWEKIKDAFLVFTGWQGLTIFGLTGLMMAVGNWKWKEILRSQNVKISFWRLSEFYLAGFALVFLVPIVVFGGEIFRSYILKEKGLVPWVKGLASIIIDRILEWTTNLAVIFLGILFFLYKIGLPPKNLAIIFGGVFLLFVIGISFFYFKIFKKESIARIFLRSSGLKNSNHNSSILDVEREIFNFFKPKVRSMWKGFGLSFLRATIMYFRAWLLIVFLGRTIGALPALSVLSFSYLAAMIPIPATLGTHEVIQSFAFNSLGLGTSYATAFTMIIRGAELIFALIGLAFLLRFGLGWLRGLLFEKIDNFNQRVNHENEDSN